MIRPSMFGLRPPAVSESGKSAFILSAGGAEPLPTQTPVYVGSEAEQCDDFQGGRRWKSGVENKKNTPFARCGC